MRTPSAWPGEVPALAAGAVHVWAVELDAEPAYELLGPAERERAADFVRDAAGRRWARARGELRHILAAHAGGDPAALAIEAAPCVHCGKPHGKPFLATPGAGWLRFNVAHSGALALIAVASGREVGVDVEATRGGRHAQRIAERWFSPAEAAALRELDDAERDAAFYRLWTRREAYLKGTGHGVLRGAMRDPVLPEGWELADLDAGPGYAAALAKGPAGAAPRSR